MPVDTYLERVFPTCYRMRDNWYICKEGQTTALYPGAVYYCEREQLGGIPARNLDLVCCHTGQIP